MSFKVLPMVPLVILLVTMVMQMVPLTLPMVSLVSKWYHWLPMVSLVKCPMVSLGEPRTDHMFSNNIRLICLILFQNLLRLSKEELECEGFQFLEPPKITRSLWDTEVIPKTTADVESQPSSAQNPMETDKCEVGNFAKWYS